MSEKIKLLLVEDEWILATVIIESLEHENIEVVHAANGVEGLDCYKSFKPEICVIDVMMPQKDGISLVKEIRAIDTQIPLIFLSSKSQTQDVLEGFKVGADDYLKKPFSMQELLLRIRALIRRTKGETRAEPLDNSLLIGAYLFNHDRQELIFEQETRRISQRESDILRSLTDNKGRVCLRTEILINHWGDDSIFNSRSLDVYITKLRKYFGHDKTIEIINVRGRGYRLKC